MPREDITPKLEIIIIVFFRGNLSIIIPKGMSDNNIGAYVAT